MYMKISGQSIPHTTSGRWLQKDWKGRNCSKTRKEKKRNQQQETSVQNRVIMTAELETLREFDCVNVLRAPLAKRTGKKSFVIINKSLLYATHLWRRRRLFWTHWCAPADGICSWRLSRAVSVNNTTLCSMLYSPLFRCNIYSRYGADGAKDSGCRAHNGRRQPMIWL